jgi:hypothetical protein
MAQLFRQVTPRTAGAHDPENSFDEASVVFRGTAGIAFLAWQELFNACPLVIS